MKLSFTTIIFVILVSMFSVLVANISNLIAIEVENSLSASSDSHSVKSANQENEETQKKKPVMGDGFKHLMWFLQISDIHVSIFHDSSRITEFQEFCEQTVEAIKPSAVLATGDLTDAKTLDNVGSTQLLSEWITYKNILERSTAVNQTLWLDIRGNHDNFNIPAPDSKLNYYRKYTVQGGKHPHSYLHMLKVNGNMYGFIGVDACLSPGPKRPFNFVGMLNRNETHNVKTLIKQAKKNKVEYTVMFGHYPTSCIITEGSTSIRNLIASGPGCWVYMCGHFHMLGGLVPNMYTLQKAGYLELELGDWKDNRIYRVAAFDHGIFNFIDVRHGVWPVILVTNPKHALYVVPAKERQNVMSESTHVRVLVFSTARISIVQIKLDDEDWINTTHVKGPLYIAKWEPSKYQIGIHNIDVRARDAEGRVQGVSQPFSLDGTRMSFRFWPRLALMCNLSTMFQAMFGVSLCFAVVPLCIFKVVHVLVRNNKMEKPNIKNKFVRRWVRSFWILSTIDRIFYPLVLYPLYLSVGPWTVGELIDGNVGVIFAWGLMVNNSYLPGSFTYAYGFLQMCTFQFPLMFVLAKVLDGRFQQRDPEQMSFLKEVLCHTPIITVSTIQMVCAYFFWLSYGTMAFLIGPLRTWSVILAIVLWKMAAYIPKEDFREADLVWNNPQDENQINESFDL